MKNILKFTVLLATICSLLIACGSDDPKYTITFQSNGGSMVENQIVEKGKTATRPETPTRTNYEFDNWYSDEALTIVYNFNDKVTGNITLYAKWIGDPYTITFNNNSGSGGPTTIEVRYGSPMTELPVNLQPIQVGFYFTGYFDAQTGGTKYYNGDFSSAKDWDKVSDTTLYAQWDTLPEMEMVLIPAGTFMMGSPADELGRNSDELQREVTLTSSFYMGKYTVTQEQYEAAIGSNPSYFHGGAGRLPVSGQVQKRRPVEQVSSYDAMVFCNKLSMMKGLTPAYIINDSTNPADWGPVPIADNTNTNEMWNSAIIAVGSNGYRLPTEAQWEYACRAGSIFPFHWGTDQISSDQANFDATVARYNNSPMGVALGVTTEVGVYTPNAWGLYDMHGNVWEWCWDWYGPYEPGPQIDPVIDEETGAVDNTGGRLYTTRVWRGGAYTQAGSHMRAAARASRGPSYRASCFGFRVSRP